MATAAAGASFPLALVGGRLVGAPAGERAVVVVEGERIVRVGPEGATAVPANARRVRLDGATIVPGLVDAHVHLTRVLLDEPEAAAAWLAAGVTTVIDLGTPLGAAALRDRVAATAGLPRVLVAGPIFTAPGGYPFAGPRSSAREVTDAADAARAAALLIERRGVDLVKVAVERGFDADVADPGWPVLEPAALAALVAAAHQRGRKVVAHLTQPGELALALEAGVDGLAHTPSAPIPRDLLQRAAARGVVLVSTLGLWREAADLLAGAQQNVRRYVELGGRVALGTDAPAFARPGLPRDELRLLAAAGLTPRQVLEAATRHAAALAGRDGELGVIAPGARADLLAIAGDPLTDPEALARVRLVVRDGEPVGDGRAMLPSE